MGHHKRRKGQSGIELLVSIGFILLVFTIVSLFTVRKVQDSTNLKVFGEAKLVLDSFADNINTISEEGSGYYRYFSLPAMLYGSWNYSVATGGNTVEIYWGENSVWARPVINSNVTVHCLDLGKNFSNRILNDQGRIVITCHRPNLRPLNNTVAVNPGEAGVVNTVILTLENDANIPYDGNFEVLFENFDMFGTCSGHYCEVLAVNGMESGEQKDIVFTTPGGWGAGAHLLGFSVDYSDAVVESIESDNNINYTMILE